MSTGADCSFYEKKPGEWYYRLQEYPYGETEDYDTQGPFKTFAEALQHLRRHNANPGGYGIKPLPGCKHDMLTERRDARFPADCDRCGHTLSRAEFKKTKMTARPKSDRS